MWILNWLPNWIFHAVLFSGVIALILSKFIPVYYRKVIQALAVLCIVTGIFMSGAIHNNEIWLSRVKELEVKLAQAEAKSAEENIKIVEKVVKKTEYYKERGKDIVQYVDREVVKYDSRCEIPSEFVEAHNRAATK
jgi:hypothetical protein